MVALRKKAPDCTGGPVGKEEGVGEGSFPMHIAQCTGASMAIAQMERSFSMVVLCGREQSDADCSCR